MVDINVQLTNIIRFLMKKMDKTEIEIPETVLIEDGFPLIATRDPINPLNQNITIRVGEQK